MPALRIRLERLGDARILDLDRDLASVEQRRPVHLADRGRGERLLLELGEVLGDRLAVLLVEHPETLLHGIGGAEVRSFASSSW